MAVASALPSSASTILIDFGDTISGTTSGLGNTWNSVVDSNPVSNMADTSGGATTIDIFISAGGFGENGGAGGGGLASPSQALLGDLAVASATNDYFFTSGTQSLTLTLGGLDPTKTYNLDFFGTREQTATRQTLYTVVDNVGSSNQVLTTSGTAIGDGGYDGNNDTVASFTNLVPNGSNQISFSFTTNNSTFGYLGAMRITAVPEPSAVIVGAVGILVLLRRRR